MNVASVNAERAEDELKELAVFLTHHLGVPLGRTRGISAADRSVK